MQLYVKDRIYDVPFDENDPRVTIAMPKNAPPVRTWADLMKSALENIAKPSLKSKKVCIIVDDWGRPTPAYEFIPNLLHWLYTCGLENDNLCFVTASGMHDPMTEEELRKKLGDETYDNFRCYSHDGGDFSNLAFVGITELGSPIWVNRHVAQADYVIAVGRVYPHITYGYEGGYKMIVPGVSSFETIMRSHSLNFSNNSSYGNIHRNPSRTEADAIGRMVGIQLLINYVIGFDGQPRMAFAGDVDKTFDQCVRYGEEQVWATVVGQKYDITIIAAGADANRKIEENPTYYIGLALDVTENDGTIIAIMDEPISKRTHFVEHYDLDTLSLSELLYIHEKRNWIADARKTQWFIKDIRGAFYSRRIMCMHKPSLYLVADRFSPNKLDKWNAQHFSTVKAAVEAALTKKPDARILVIPEGTRTFPMVSYSIP